MDKLSNQFEMKIVVGNSNPILAKEIQDYLEGGFVPIVIKKFSDGETYVKIEENVRGRDVFVIQSTCPPVNENLVELMIIIDALKRASAARITAVIPYYGYSRQDRKVVSREPISAKLVANLITASGADRVLSVDLHCGQLQGFFDIPLDHLTAISILVNEIKSRNFKDAVIVSPDAGGTKKARRFAEALNLPMALLDKRRVGHNEISDNINVIGELEGKTALIVDDMIDTAGTMSLSCKALMAKGAREVFVLATHPVFSGSAVEKLNIPEIKEVIVTNTVPIVDEKKFKGLKVLSIAPLIAEGIERIHNHESLSELFNGEK